jgi:hypothetical protein
MRLDKDTYLAVQGIYYPGFTYGGLREGLGMLATLVLLLLTPTASARFWWILTALVALVAMHAVYWLVTHPVNKYWLRDTRLTGIGREFFSLDPMRKGRRLTRVTRAGKGCEIDGSTPMSGGQSSR